MGVITRRSTADPWAKQPGKQLASSEADGAKQRAMAAAEPVGPRRRRVGSLCPAGAATAG